MLDLPSSSLSQLYAPRRGDPSHYSSSLSNSSDLQHHRRTKTPTHHKRSLTSTAAPSPLISDISSSLSKKTAKTMQWHSTPYDWQCFRSSSTKAPLNPPGATLSASLMPIFSCPGFPAPPNLHTNKRQSSCMSRASGTLWNPYRSTCSSCGRSTVCVERAID